jgi:hypothetical protein
VQNACNQSSAHQHRFEVHWQLKSAYGLEIDEKE